MGNDDTTTITVNNLGATPVSYVITSGTPGQEPIVGSLPAHSFGIIEHEFSGRLAVTIGDQQVAVGPNGMVTFVPQGVSGLVGTFEFAGPTPSV